MKWWAIYTNLPIDVIVRLTHPRSGHSLDQKTFLAPSADKQTHNYDIECSNHHPSLSTLRPKGLGRWKMKSWAIYTNFTVDIVVRLTHPPSADSQGQEMFLAPSAHKPTSNYDIECSNHHPALSTLRPKGLSHSKMKMWAIQTKLTADNIIRLPHPRSGSSHNQDTSLAPSTDKPTRNYDIECSNHHPSLSTQRPKRLSTRKMKWWAIHTKLPMDVIVRLPHPPSGDSQDKETFPAPSIDKETHNYEREYSNYHPSLWTLRAKGLGHIYKFTSGCKSQTNPSSEWK